MATSNNPRLDFFGMGVPAQNSVVFASDRRKPGGTNLTISSGSDAESVSRSTKRSFRVLGSGYVAVNSGMSNFPQIQNSQNFTANTYVQQGLPMDVLEKCRKKFVRTALSEQIEYGYGSASEHLLDNFFDTYKSNIGAIVQHIFLKESANSRVTIPLLKGVSNFGYYEVYPYAQTVAIAALTNIDPEVREAGIRAFENWGNADGITSLKAVETPLPWLNSYRLATIAYLETSQ